MADMTSLIGKEALDAWFEEQLKDPNSIIQRRYNRATDKEAYKRSAIDAEISRRLSNYSSKEMAELSQKDPNYNNMTSEEQAAKVYEIEDTALRDSGFEFHRDSRGALYIDKHPEDKTNDSNTQESSNKTHVSEKDDANTPPTNDGKSNGDDGTVPPTNDGKDKTDDDKTPPTNDGNDNGGGETPPPSNNETQNRTPNTVRARTSDEWDTMLQDIDVAVLREMGKDVTGLEQTTPNLTNEEAVRNNAERVNKIKEMKDGLTPDEREEFTAREAGIKRSILESYPPKRLVEADLYAESARDTVQDQAQQQKWEAVHQELLSVMKGKITDYAEGKIVVDQSNIADVYDGAKEMLAHVQERTEENENNAPLLRNIRICDDKLEKEIDVYDENNGFKGLTPEDAQEINDTYNRAQEVSKKVTIPPKDFETIWEHIDITDDNGQEITDPKKRQEYIDSFNEAALKQAVRNASVKNKGAKKEELAEAIQAELHQGYLEQIIKSVQANELAKHEAEEYQKAQADPNYQPKPYTSEQAQQDLSRAMQEMETGKYKLNSKSIVSNFATYTNSNLGYLNRLGTKIGKDKPVLGKMYNNVRNFDKTCVKRFDPYYSQAKSFTKAVAGSSFWQFSNMAARGICMGVPGGNFMYAGYVAATSSFRLIMRYRNEKKRAEAEGKKLSGWDFIKQNKWEIGSSIALTCAAAIPFGSVLAKQAVAGAASIAALWGSGKKIFKAARENGDSKKKAWWKVATTTAAGLGAALLGGVAAGGVMHAMDGSEHCNSVSSWWNKHVLGEGNGESTSEILPKEQAEALKGLTDEQLAEKGMVREECGADDQGAYLAGERAGAAQPTHDYNQETETPWGKMRMGEDDPSNLRHDGYNEGLRHSEYIPGDWTHPDYANNPSALANSLTSLDALAADHTEMNTNVDGTLVPNSEMLAYKVYQLNVLVPNEGALMDNGQTAGEFFSYQNADGSTVNYHDLQLKMTHGETLTDNDFKLLMKIEDHVGGQNEGGVNDMGKIIGLKMEDKFSYQHDANPGYDTGSWQEKVPYYERVAEQHNAGMFIPAGLTFMEYESAKRQMLAERQGANGRRVIKEKPEDTYIPPQIETPEKKQLPNKEKPVAGYLPDKEKPIAGYLPDKIAEIRGRIENKEKEKLAIEGKTTPQLEGKTPLQLEAKPSQEDDKYGYGKLLADEYKIVYGVDPQVIDRGTKEKPDREYQSWIAYNNRVDAERQATGRDINMYDFLTERRQKLDSMIEGLGDTHTTVVGVARDNRGVGAQDVTDAHGQPKNEISSKADYKEHKDNPGMAAVIADARQSMRQSNLTADNYNRKVTLTHFMDYLSQYLVSSSFVADGTRDISKNPQLKRDIQSKEGDKHHFVADLNEFYFPKKEDNRTYKEKREQIMVDNEENQQKGFWPAARDVITKMRNIYTTNHPIVTSQRER